MSDDYKVDMYNGHPLIVQLNKHFASIQAIVDEGIAGPPGEDGVDGVDGDDGWSPVFAIESDLSARYLKVVDWVGGTGTKPTANLYVTATGLEATSDNAIDIRGPQGIQGETGDTGPQGPEGDSLEFMWNGTELGVRVEGEVSFTYVDLEGPQGPAGADGDDGQGVPVGGTSGQVLAKASATDYDTEWVDQSGGVSTFTGLSDTPSSYTGNAGKIAAVNTGETALEFIDAPSGGGGGGTFGSWTPTFTNFSGAEIIVSRGFYYDTGDMVFINGECIIEASTAADIIIDNLPVAIDDTAAEYSVCLTVSPLVNRDLPSGLTGVRVNRFNSQIRFVNNTGGLVETNTTAWEGFGISGWYKKSTT